MRMVKNMVDEMRRKMATVQRVLSVEPIEGADRIQKIRVLGWQLVAKKDEFKPGDFCVFCEIDSQLPEHPSFEFLRDKKFRIRTAKFKGVLSQGLAIPLDNPYLIEKLGTRRVIEGQDVSEFLEVHKYEPPVPAMLMGKIKGFFPTHIVPKTDELRVQSYVNDKENVLNEFAGRTVYITTKVDGTSFTAYYHAVNDAFGVCSRNLELKPDDENTHWKIARQYNVEKKLRDYHAKMGVSLAIQGEIAGPGINGNPLGLRNAELFVFNIWNIDEHRYLDYPQFVATLGDIELPMVPLQCENVAFTWTLEQLLELAKGKYANGRHREGIVIRPVKECTSGILNGRLSIKVINNDHLLAGGS